MEKLSKSNGNRRYRKVLIEILVNFQKAIDRRVGSGILINAGEVGLLVRSFKEVGIGERLSIVALSSENFGLKSLLQSRRLFGKMPTYGMIGKES